MINKYKEIFENKAVGEILYNEPMKNHTSFEIGGPADIFLIPTSEEELVNAVKLCRENNINYLVLGNGSNLLVRDKGIRGVVIKTNKFFNKIEVVDKKIFCKPGALLVDISNEALKNSLKGFEFAEGIPGSIGGAVAMNAGAYGGEMKDIVSKVRVMDKNNNILEFSNEEMNFRYRNSRVWDECLIVLGVEITLEPGIYEEIESNLKELNYKRVSKQPLELPSGGSTFKRPEGYFAGKLIDDAGLRGLRYGGAGVSEKHCGFVVNLDKATCNDVMTLIATIQKVVKDKYGVDLEREIKILGED